MPGMIDLTCYNVEAVRTLADFLCDVDVRNFRLSGSMLLDLLQLCRIFDIARLKEFLSVVCIILLLVVRFVNVFRSLETAKTAYI